MPTVWAVSTFCVGEIASNEEWAALDGRLNAPAGPAQYPTLLNAYGVNRPPWDVSGVDYRVGPPVGQVYKVPGVDSPPANVVMSTGSKIMDVNGTATVDGWDLSGGWQCHVYHGTNVTISNNNIGNGSRLQWRVDSGATATGAIIKYNIIDGNGVDVSVAPLKVNPPGGGPVVIQYNWIKNSFAVLCDLGWEPGSQDIRFNIIENAGWGSTQAAHGDLIQWLGGTITGPINFNLVHQDLPGQGTQGFSFNAGEAVMNGLEVSNNTFVCKTNTNPINFIIGQWQQTPFVLTDNYVDPTGTDPNNFLHNDTAFGPGPFPSGGPPVVTGNINMLTGSSNI